MKTNYKMPVVMAIIGLLGAAAFWHFRLPERAIKPVEEHVPPAGEEDVVKLTAAQITNSEIVVEAAAPGDLFIEISLPGSVKLNADQLSHIVPRFAGAVKEIKKRQGDKVRKGDTLAVIESNESLSTYQVKALIDGTIIQKHATIGEMIPENTEIFVIANLNTVWIDVDVYAKDLLYVRAGQRAHVNAVDGSLDAIANVEYVAPVVNEHTRAAMARLILPNREGRWRPGMFVVAKVEVEKISVPVRISKDAVQMIESTQSVFKKTANGFKHAPVKLGREDHSFVEVISGLEAGELYVSHGSFNIKAEKGKSEASHEH